MMIFQLIDMADGTFGIKEVMIEPEGELAVLHAPLPSRELAQQEMLRLATISALSSREDVG